MAEEKTTTTIGNWNEVDSCLKALGNLGDKIQETEGTMNSEIDAVRSKYSTKLERWNTEKQELNTDLNLFLESNVKDFKEAKTKTFAHGEISYKKSGQASLDFFNKNTETDVIEKIKDTLKPKEIKLFIRIKETLNKQAIKSADLGADVLKQIGLKLVQSFSFAVKIYK